LTFEVSRYLRLLGLRKLPVHSETISVRILFDYRGAL